MERKMLWINLKNRIWCTEARKKHTNLTDILIYLRFITKQKLNGLDMWPEWETTDGQVDLDNGYQETRKDPEEDRQEVGETISKIILVQFG